MKKLLAGIAALSLLGACSQEAEEPAAPVEDVAAAPAASTATMETYVGAWTVTMPDGSTHTTTNNLDGTFTRTMTDGTSNGGTWTFAAEQSCWTTEGEEPTCYTISETAADGTLTLTNVADQSVVTATRATEGMAPVEGAEMAAEPAAAE